MHKETKKKILFYLATKLVWLLILFLGKTGRIRVKNRSYWDAAIASPHGVLVIVWHGRMLLPIYIHRNLGITAMVSQHADGEMIARSVHRLGYRTVRGSSTRGGSLAFRQMLARLNKAETCALMPDGPRGPAREIKPGSLLLAQLSGCYLLPMSFAASRPIRMKSWDRFMLWWPFSKLLLIYGRPIRIPRKSSADDLHRWREKITKAMNQLAEEADAAF